VDVGSEEENWVDKSNGYGFDDLPFM